jgi:esterase/lipase superfamily enzyme
MQGGSIMQKRLPRLGLMSLLGLMVLASAGCAARPPSSVLIPVPPIADAEGGKTVSVLAATTRARSDDASGAFTNDRARTVSYEQYAISFPPSHVAGHVEWPRQPPGDPRKDVVVTDAHPLEQSGFAAAIARRLEIHKDEAGNVLVFVHGYNTSYQEAVLRLAQLEADSSFGETSVLFAWPSHATLTGYLADRESSTYSRDYLEQVLNEIAAIPNVHSINLVAHSMGNWLAVETLRQAKLRAHSPFLAKLGNVVLLSADIDVNVFETQLDVIKKLNHPIIVAVARNDLALAASQRLAGDVQRVGNVVLDNPRVKAAIEQHNLQVVDLSQVKGDALGHSKFIEALPELERIARNEDLGDAPSEAAPGIFVVNAAGEVLETPLRITNAFLGR